MSEDRMRRERRITLVASILCAGIVGLVMAGFTKTGSYNDFVDYAQKDCLRRVSNGQKSIVRVDAQRKGEQIDADFLDSSAVFRRSQGQTELAEASETAAASKRRLANELENPELPNCAEEVPDKRTVFP